ncbi:MAG TPA: S8 family serine peptidase, partial [Candidatus Angelobacter sp.]|nr:S8 family serine peptidase [Candidatus Angelobacter sp.]
MKRSGWLLALIFIPILVAAQASKLSPELQSASGMRAVPVIVQYKNVPVTTQRGAIQTRNGQVVGQLAVINGMQASVPAASLAALAADPSVAYVSPDRVVRGHMNNAAPAVMANYGWGLGLNGSKIGVAVIDSGIHGVDDVGSRVLASFDYTGEGADDLYGHGTHVAGAIGGNGFDSTCASCSVVIQGIAPK